MIELDGLKPCNLSSKARFAALDTRLNNSDLSKRKLQISGSVEQPSPKLKNPGGPIIFNQNDFQAVKSEKRIVLYYKIEKETITYSVVVFRLPLLPANSFVFVPSTQSIPRKNQDNHHPSINPIPSSIVACNERVQSPAPMPYSSIVNTIHLDIASCEHRKQRNRVRNGRFKHGKENRKTQSLQQYRNIPLCVSSYPHPGRR